MTDAVYVYRGKPYCYVCGPGLCDRLKASMPPLDPDRSYSTDEFPDLRVLPPSDRPHECAECHSFLYLPVTEAGRRYVVGAVLNELYAPSAPREFYLSDTMELWAEHYAVTVPELLELARNRAAAGDASTRPGPQRSGICTDTDDEIADALARRERKGE